MVHNRRLSRTYTLLAPLYDFVVAPVFPHCRKLSIASLVLSPGERLLVSGAGTGLDFAYVPAGVHTHALDLTPAMLARARRRARRAGSRPGLYVADAMRLPFRDACFDAAALHLILAVVPDPRPALAEAARVVKPGGRIAVFDKFVREGSRAGLGRRAADRLLRPFVTGLNTCFEDVLRVVPELNVEADQPALAGGLFRRILLRRR